MTAWSWPQFLVALMICLKAVDALIKILRNPILTSETVTVLVFAWIAYSVAAAYVLHAGGFW